MTVQELADLFTSLAMIRPDSLVWFARPDDPMDLVSIDRVCVNIGNADYYRGEELTEIVLRSSEEETYDLEEEWR